MFKRASQPPMPELDPVLQTWLVGSQKTTEGLNNPHAVIIPGHGIRYSSTPDLDPAYIEEINRRRAENHGLGPLSVTNESEVTFVFNPPGTGEIVRMMVSEMVDCVRTSLRH